MEWLAILAGIGIISSLLDKRSSSSSHSPKATSQPKNINEWDSEIQGKGVLSGSSWDRLRRAVLVRDNYTCCSCGRKDNLTVDHIVQLSQGGTNNLVNLQTLCKYCHEKKITERFLTNHLTTTVTTAHELHQVRQYKP